jgi:hypothetical protein
MSLAPAGAGAVPAGAAPGGAAGAVTAGAGAGEALAPAAPAGGAPAVNNTKNNTVTHTPVVYFVLGTKKLKPAGAPAAPGGAAGHYEAVYPNLG